MGIKRQIYPLIFRLIPPEGVVGPEAVNQGNEANTAMRSIDREREMCYINSLIKRKVTSANKGLSDEKNLY